MVHTKRLLELDSLRGLAALSVCFFHFGFYDYGITGVDLFFMISGFVIYMSIAKVNSLKEFVASRFSRLYPMYWFSLFISLAFCSACRTGSELVKWNYVLGNITMLQPLFKSEYLAGVYWTLYIEMMFYGFIVILWLTKAYRNIELTVLIILTIIASLHSIFILYNKSWPEFERFFIALRGLLPLVSHFHFFAAGMIFFRIFSHGFNVFRVFLLFSCFLLIALIHNLGGRNFYFTNVLEHLALSASYFLLFTLIVTDKVAVLKHKAFIFFGYISYALYLFHGTFGVWIEYEAATYFNKTFSIILGIGSSIIFSYLITFYYDIPIRAYLKRLLSQ